MFSFMYSVVEETFAMFMDAAPYMVMGIAISGLLKAFIDQSLVQRYLGGTGFLPVLRASIAGIPLPLCSCGVIPAAAALRKQGASSSATMSFLISTPQSGIDSIALSYALLDPIMTVARPIVAFVSAFIAGGLSVLFGGPEAKPIQESCNCSGHSHHHDHDDKVKRGKNWIARLEEGFSFAVFDVWGDLSNMFFLGIILSGVISVAVPETFLERSLGGGLSSMILMAVIGIPMYTCATSSTPLAAALILKGVSPGAALVFLMAGPATSIINVPLIYRILGTRRLVIYLASIAFVSISAGLTVDHLYHIYQISAQATMGQGADHLPLWLQIGAATVLLTTWLANRVRSKPHGGGKTSLSCDRS